MLVLVLTSCENGLIPAEEGDVTGTGRNVTSVISFTVNGQNASSGYLFISNTSNFTVNILTEGVAYFEMFKVNGSVVYPDSTTFPYGQSYYTFNIYSPGGFTFEAMLDNITRNVTVNSN